MNISIDELKKIIEIILSLVNTHSNDSIVVESDFYWDIPMEDIYNPYEKPTELTIGQLSDDWQELKNLIMEDRMPNFYDFKRLSNIIKIHFNSR